ncbi:DNA-directed DNA polymerase [Microbotryomycetes sp. JL221]|nr:DNA-directed DNA polymerase [Microbotryomycetes sp. JL221]
MARDQPSNGKSSATQGASILPLFPLLSSHDLPTRLDASVSLLSTLPVAGPSSSGSTSNGSTDVQYTIKRLVTGLGSANEAARPGFATALTELLSRLPHAEAAAVLPVIISSSTPTNSSDSKEERELLFGRLFGLHAFLRSGIPTSPQAQDEELFKEVILALVALSNKKSWIKESAYWVIVQAVRDLQQLQGKKAPKFKNDAISWVAQRLLVDAREKGRGWTPEKVALVLALQSYETDIDFKSVLAPTFPSGNVLSRNSLSALAQALKGSTGQTDATANGPSAGANAIKTSKTAPTIGNAAPHFVWNEIFDVYFPQAESQKQSPSIDESIAKWNDLWRIVVDQSLFAPPSIPLKATGFALLTMALQRVSPTEVANLFGAGVVRTLGNNLRKTSEAEKTLGRTAEKFVNSLTTFLSTNPSAAFPVLKTLVNAPHGSYTFDPKTIEKLVNKLDTKGVRAWVKFLKEVVLVADEAETEQAHSEDTTEGAQDGNRILAAQRMWAFDQLLHVAKSAQVPKDDEESAGLLEFFAVLGWFDVRKTGTGARSYAPTPPLTENQKLAARSRFFSILSAFLASKDFSSATWLSRALALLANLASDKKHFVAVDEWDEELVEARQRVKTMYETLKGDDERQKAARALAEGVLLLSYDEGEETMEALEQLSDCLPLLFPAQLSAKAPTPEDSGDDEDGEEPEPATVLVDLVLELLHRPSAFVKGIAQRAFVGFSEDLSEQGMELLLEQIRPEVSETEEQDEDAEMADADQKKDGSDSESSDDEVADDDDDDDDVEVDEAFKEELLAALQESGVADLASDEDDEASEDREEEYLDDDQMLALDDKLADIFRNNSGGRKTKKLARTEDMHYRLRVVDLVESLYKAKPASPLLLMASLPLFGISRSSSSLEDELRVKATRLLRQIVQSKKDQITPEVPESALEALAELHGLASGIDAADLAPLCSQTALFLVKAALASPSATTETAEQISTFFGDSFETYVVKKNSKTKVQPALTLEFVKRSPACAWPLFDRVLRLLAVDSELKPVNAFRLMQVLEIAQTLLTSYSATRTPASKQDILAAMPIYNSTLLTIVKASIAGDDKSYALDASRLRDVLKSTLAATRQTLNAADGKSTTAAAIWKAKDWEAIAEQARQSERFKNANGLLNAFKQLVGILNGFTSGDVKAKTGGKRKAADDVEKSSPKKGKSLGEKQVTKDKAAEQEVQVVVNDSSMGSAAMEPAAAKKSKKDKKAQKKAAKLQ